jgi:hypothetical protein
MRLSPARGLRPGLPALLALLVFLASLFGLGTLGVARASAETYVPPELFSEPEAEPPIPGCAAAPESLSEPAEPSPEPEVFALLGEVRAERVDLAAACEAQAGASHEELRRLWWLVEEVVWQTRHIQTTNERLTELVASSCSNPCSVFFEGQSKAVEISGGEGGGGELDTGELVASIDAAGEGSSVALWTIAGILVGLFIAYAIYKAVDRGL